MTLAEIIKNLGDDVLTEDSKKAIVEAFELAVDAKVDQKLDERVKLEVENAIQQLDEDHSAKLQELLEAIDKDHTEKFKKVLIKVDGDYAEKLQNVINKYEGMLKEEAIKFRDQLVGEISNYIELYVDKLIPAEQISEACENIQAKKIVDGIKKLVSVDEEFISDNIREALQDGKSTIDTLRQELAEAVKVNVKLNQENKSVKSQLILEKKTAAMADDKKAYIMRVLKEKSPEDVNENFDYVVEMFERDEADAAEIITEQAKASVASKNVEVPKSEIEDDIVSKSESSVEGYLKELKR